MPVEPFRTTSHELLDRLSPVSGSPFVCPGSASAVSRAIHLARLNAAWPGCDQCEWRFDSEGLAARTVHETAQIRSQRADGIRRTEFGIRGQYINDLDRRTTADLTRIFINCLHEQSALDDIDAGARRSPRETRPGQSVATQPDKSATSFQAVAPLVVGYDGRSASVDLAIGVVAASREFGMPVIDVGRCTAASIQEASRCFHESCGAILVTGAGSPNSWAGVDVFDRHGEAVPVVWKDFGVQLEHVCSDAATFLKLQLPDAAARRRWARRLTRQSGSHDVVNFEDRYRDWMLRWYPKQSGLRILVRTDDVLLQQRLVMIAQTTGLEIISRGTPDSTLTPHVALTIIIPEDDRQFHVLNAYGQPVNSERLALALNRAMHTQSSQITAHADAASDRFWLTDAARTGARQSTESIHDALVTLGLIARLTESKRLTADL